MFAPSFNEDDFNRVKNQLIQGLEQGNKDARTLASRGIKTSYLW